MEESGDTLLSFINNVSSSVKTVLSKPGNFKRNTNHRRFLQKQLKLNCQSISIDKVERKSTREKLFCLNKIRGRITSTDIETASQLRKNLSSKSHLASQSRIAIDSSVKQDQRSASLTKDCCPFDMSYPEDVSTCDAASISSQSPVPSPTHDYSEVLKSEFENFYSDCFCEENVKLQVESQFVLNNCNYVEPDNMDLSFVSCTTRSPFSSSFPVPSASNEELRGTEFLSGEDLLNSLEISDLFVPCRDDLVDRVGNFQNQTWPMSENVDANNGRLFCTFLSSSYFGASLENVFQAHCL